MLPPDHFLSRGVNLAFNVTQAAFLPHLRWDRAVFGDKSDYGNLPPGIGAEFPSDLASGSGVFSMFRALRTIPPLKLTGRRQSGPLQDQGLYAGKYGAERWFFMNGICADVQAAQSNASALSGMFQRPITVLYNVTEGLVPDLYESALNKGYDSLTDAAAGNMLAVVEALCDAAIERVVWISHSQGTIITSIMLKTLQEWLEPQLPQGAKAVKSGAGAHKLSPERLSARRLAGKHGKQPVAAKVAERRARECLRPEHIAKLECYCFANCSTSLTPIALTGTPPRHTPWLESFGNEFDLVARLGLLAPPHGIGSARIEGDRYRRDKFWGHLFNVHYLAPLERELSNGGSSALKPFGENLLETPRLFEYYAGKSPSPTYP
jgi:hypothetical protein